jgi:hypothetical protein
MSVHVSVINTSLARTIEFTSMQRNTLMCVTCRRSRRASLTRPRPVSRCTLASHAGSNGPRRMPPAALGSEAGREGVSAIHIGCGRTAADGCGRRSATSKTVEVARLPWVRIPSLPPSTCENAASDQPSRGRVPACFYPVSTASTPALPGPARRGWTWELITVALLRPRRGWHPRGSILGHRVDVHPDGLEMAALVHARRSSARWVEGVKRAVAAA